ncbi:uncharacterized protein [Euwallacea similis]|uniref:uncharacterized protein n=1 Tax=Euwallacea similis TaxID=1736056 RepID=UPI00344B640B
MHIKFQAAKPLAIVFENLTSIAIVVLWNALPEDNAAQISNRRSQNRTLGRPHRSSSSTSSNLGVLPIPKPRIYDHKQNTGFNVENINDGGANDPLGTKPKHMGETESENIVVLTGTVERVIKYGKIFQNQFCYFQVFGSVVSMTPGRVPFENTMLLKDKKGPIMQLVYYSNASHINIENFHFEQNLRAFGRMTGPNIMSALSIRAATEEELEILPRMCYISDYAISTLCGSTK